MTNPVIVTRHGKVALVSLNNPPVNALSHAVRSALRAALQELFVGSDAEAPAGQAVRHEHHGDLVVWEHRGSRFGLLQRARQCRTGGRVTGGHARG
jgi:3-hydroxyacyl-CoA dehydrogenase